MFVPDGKRHKRAGLLAAVAKRDHVPPIWYHALILLFISSSMAFSSGAVVLVSLTNNVVALSLPNSRSSKPTRTYRLGGAT
jgi:hypothetical protein